MNDSSLFACGQRHLPETLEFLRQMVAINSFTANAAGVNRLGDLIAAAFTPLGFSAEAVAASNPAYGRHLVLRSGRIPDAPTVALISHLDTVFSEEEEQRHNFAWRVEGSRIYGPGTNDIKGGTALIYLLLKVLRETAPEVFAKTNWSVLFNACEEVTSADFGALCRAHLPANTLACLIFEGDGGGSNNYSLVSARKGRATFGITVSGRAAHAGSEHRRGANAIVQMAEVLADLHRLTDYTAGLTINIGSVSGGTVANRVPHHATAELEMRAFDPQVYARAKRHILGWDREGEIGSAGDAFRCRVAAELTHETGPWPRNPATDGLFAIWEKAGRDLGLVVGTEERGGLSDGNALWKSFPTLDGLGPRGEHSHCSEHDPAEGKEQEWVDVDSFVPKMVLNTISLLRLPGLATER